jgi:hypothetical protein
VKSLEENMKILLTTAIIIALASPIVGHAGEKAAATAQPSACSVLPGLESLEGVCETKEFKDYTHCIDKYIPNWHPKRKVLKNNPNFTAAAGVLSVLAECEPLARIFGERVGNSFANLSQDVANHRIARAYGTDPIAAPPCDENFVEYGQKVAFDSKKDGDVAVPPRTYAFHGVIRRP